MQDMSRQLLKHMDEVRTSERESRDKEAKQIQRLKRELHSMESQLNAEKALHAITKSALQNLEEDCTRLRQQLHNIRRRGYNQDKSVLFSSCILIDLQSGIFLRGGVCRGSFFLSSCICVCVCGGGGGCCLLVHRI